MTFFYFFCLVMIFGLAFFISARKAYSFRERPASRPFYYGITGSMISCAWAIIIYTGLFFFRAEEKMPGVVFSAAAAAILSWYFITPQFHAQKRVEKIIRCFMGAAACLSVLITLAIVATLFFEAIRFFNLISIKEFLFGIEWNPRMTYGAIMQKEDCGLYGALPLFTGTLLIMLIAMAIALPTGLFIAIYTREYAKVRTRNILKPIIEILAGIPTIVYGFFALVAIMPLLQNIGDRLGVEISPQSALGVGIMMGLMIIPYISSLSDDALASVSQALRDNSLALGATSSETIKKVVIPAAMPGIIAAVLLAVSRAIGETMLVVMAAGLTANLTFNPLDSVTTMTVQMVSLLTGDQEFDSPKTLSAFALGMTLFLMTLLLNFISLRVARRYHDKYDI